MVGGCQFIYRDGAPGTAEVAVFLEEPYQSPAVGGNHAELVLDRDFRDPVAVDVMRSHVHQTVHVLNQDVAIPRGVLVPGHLLDARSHAHNVESPVVVDVGRHHGVSARDFGFNHVCSELNRARCDGMRFGRVPIAAEERTAEQESSQ